MSRSELLDTQLQNGVWEWAGDVEGLALPLEPIMEGVSTEATLKRAQELVEYAIAEARKSYSDVAEDDWLQNFWFN